MEYASLSLVYNISQCSMRRCGVCIIKPALQYITMQHETLRHIAISLFTISMTTCGGIEPGELRTQKISMHYCTYITSNLLPGIYISPLTSSPCWSLSSGNDDNSFNQLFFIRSATASFSSSIQPLLASLHPFSHC